MIHQRLFQPADAEPTDDEGGDDEQNELQKLVDSPGFRTMTFVLEEPSAR